MRRVKIAHINSDMIVSAFMYPEDRIMDDFNDFTLNFLKLTGVPTDYKVVYGYYDALRHTFTITISSEEFDEVPQGEVPPTIEVHCEAISFKSKGSKFDNYQRTGQSYLR